MRVLVVDDEVRLASSLKVGLEAEGFAVDVAYDGTDGLWLAREHDVRRDRARPDAAGHQRLQGLRGPARREELDPDPDAHRQGRRVGPGRGARHRRRRLPHQAVLLPGPRGAAARSRPAWRARAPDHARGRRPAPRPGGASRLARRGRDRADRAGVLAARVPRTARRATSSPSARSSRPCGTTTSRATRTSSRSTSATCATRSTGRSVARRSRPCAVRATGWGATVAERRWAGASVRTRTTVAAVLVVAVALVVGAFTLVVLVRESLRDGVETSAEQRASSLADEIDSSGLPAQPPADERRRGRRRPRGRGLAGDRLPRRRRTQLPAARPAAAPGRLRGRRRLPGCRPPLLRRDRGRRGVRRHGRRLARGGRRLDRRAPAAPAGRPATAAAARRRHHLDGRDAGARPGRAHPERGRPDHRRPARAARAGAALTGRDLPARDDHEPDAGAARGLQRPAAAVRRRRVPRAAVAARRACVRPPRSRRHIRARCRRASWRRRSSRRVPGCSGWSSSCSC